MTTFSPSLGPGSVPTAMDYRIAKFRGHLRKFLANLTGRENQLVDLGTLTRGRNVHSRHYARIQPVCIDEITGSEGRCQDFDASFHPLKSHNKDRWLRIAQAWSHGVNLPAIDLIKVKDVYVVRDGHHRISVARYLGCRYLDAQVTEWVLENE